MIAALQGSNVLFNAVKSHALTVLKFQRYLEAAFVVKISAKKEIYVPIRTVFNPLALCKDAAAIGTAQI